MRSLLGEIFFRDPIFFFGVEFFKEYSFNVKNCVLSIYEVGNTFHNLQTGFHNLQRHPGDGLPKQASHLGRLLYTKCRTV